MYKLYSTYIYSAAAMSNKDFGCNTYTVCWKTIEIAQLNFLIRTL